jgi:hypothetical protein
MRRGPFCLWPVKKSALWPALAMVMLLAGLTACGSQEPDVAAPAEEGATASGRSGPQELVALSPTGEVALADGFTFTWELPAGTEGGAWHIVVFAGGSDPIWESPRMTFTEFEAPPALLLKLQPGRSYTWRVAGNMSPGGRARTPLTRFVTR